MKAFFTIAGSFFCSSIFATNYYVKIGGNNNLSGKDINNAWATIAKVNSFTGFNVGDTVKLEGGSTFIGPLIPPRNGVAGKPFVITSYGIGEAIITGFTTLTGWTSLGGNIWECTPSPQLRSTCNILTFNNVPQQIGRTPNSSYYTYQSATTSQLITSAISGATNYTGAEVVMRCNAFVMQRMTITSQSSTSSSVTFNYSRTALGMDNANPKSPEKGSSNYGFFLQRFAGSLDQQGEWYYNPTTHKMRVYSTSNPSGFTIKASYIDTLVVLGSRSYITLDNISIEGAGVYGVYGNVSSTGNLAIKNCSFNNNTRAIYLWNCFASYVINNTVNNSFNVGILIFNRQQKQMTIDTNTVTNTGILVGNGIFPSNENLCALVTDESDTTPGTNFARIRRNVIRNVGYMALKFKGSNVRVSQNITDSMCRHIDDGGGIYTFINNQSVNTQYERNRIVDSNFISNNFGAPAGTNRTTPDAVGYYMDDQASYVNGYHNTIWNISGNGAQFNNPYNMTFWDNTIYNADYAVSINMKPFGPLTNNKVTRNIAYQKTTTQYNFVHTNSNLSKPTPITITQSMQRMAFIDTNWISNIKTAGYSFYYSTDGVNYTFPSPYTLATWRSNIFHDIVSILPPTVVTATNTNFYTNKTDTVRVIRFDGLSKVDPKGMVYNNIAAVPQWSSLILIDNGNAQPVNQYPIADAGTDTTITVPASTASLNGSNSHDPDGTIILYHWVQLSGPNASSIATENASKTVVSGLIAGIYQYQLTVTDNNNAQATSLVRVTVNVPPNRPPTANAGEDRSIVSPKDTVRVVGIGTDPDGSIVGYLWAKISGPSGGSITSPTSATTPITALQQGTYSFKLTVTDNGGSTASDIMNVVVYPANTPPTANAGLNQATTLPVNFVTLSGSGSDVDGTVASFLWTKISGPSGGDIDTPTDSTTDILNLQEGTYVYQLLVTDNQGATGTSFVQVVVNPAAPPDNQAPISDAGANQTITLPQNSATLVGNGVDPDGTIASYLWTKLSGPSGGNITSASTASTGITALQQGTYAYGLTVTDNRGATATSYVQIVVNPAAPPVNQAPTANAGEDKNVTLPTDITSFAGGGTDADGVIVSYAWTKVIGPTGGTIVSPSSATTAISSLHEGTYSYKLTVVDNNGDSASDYVQIIVNAAPPNAPPLVFAGNDTTIVLPANNVNLNGIASDTDGVVTSYEWRQLSGPSNATITPSNAATTNISSLVQGVYIFQFKATDNHGDTATDALQVTVNPANLVPILDGGGNKMITLPQDTVTLSATASDADGTIVSTLWTKVSGPSGGTIESPSSLTTLVSGLVEGVHVYKIKVVDNSGDSAVASVQITVNPAPIITKPAANAGEDQIIYEPDSTAVLTGSGTNGTGTITSHVWSLFSGPSGGDISDPTNYTTGVTHLVEGTYIYKLTVTDNNGLIGTDLVQIVVRAVPELKSVLLRGYH